ncbi:DUF4270 family protein [Labilibaculum sp.]|uniref:DUF4270 family protein n=1 Tax=Labilibaculum sp. TaxID=2060723 RepID=UPI003562E86B
MQKISLFFLLVSVFFISCSDDYEEHEIGEDLVDNSTDVRLIDTFTIYASTVILDSIATSDADVMTVGRYVDPYLGTVTSNGFTKIGLGGSFDLEANDDPVYDSIVFVTYYDEDYYGDTTVSQTLNLYRVTEEMELEEDESGNEYLYNVSSFEIDTVPLGSKTFTARPMRTSDSGDEYNFRMNLSDEFGQELIDMAIDHDETLQASAEWENYLEGVSLRPAVDDDATILNFQTSNDTLMYIRLYYHETSTTTDSDEVLYHDFPIGSSSYVFSNYQSDRTGTPLEKLVEQKYDLSSEDAGQRTFIQGGIGLMTKLIIPYIENLSTLGLAGSLLKAKLIFYPAIGSYDDDLYPLPDSFNLYTCDDYNDIESALYSSSGAALTSVFYEDEEYGEESYFTFDVTSHFNDVLTDGDDDTNTLLISLESSSLSNSTDRMVLTNDKATDFEFKIEATYVVQDEE